MSNAEQNAQDMEALQITVAEAKAKIERQDMLTRLEANPDFRELIENGFMGDHAIRQVMLKAPPAIQDEMRQQLLDQQITAIGGLKQFFVNIFAEGQEARVALADAEEAMEEVAQEGLE